MRTQPAHQPHITRILRVTTRRNGQPLTVESCIHLPINASDRDIQTAIAASLSLYENPLAPAPVDHGGRRHADVIAQSASNQQWQVLRALAAEVGYGLALLDELIRSRNCDPRTLTKTEARALIDDFQHEIIQPISVLTY